ncbi:MAG: NADH:ubiquinone reductase (Na(+)-transporting) subunit C [Bacteroidota bacterium]|nr:NADH:ubiquinone reductase (Na(+)-transporting) subunit C [Bacteroidota bacterium]
MSNKNSNSYIIIYTCILTIACGTILYLAASFLKPAQDANIELDRKKKILSTIIKLDKTWTPAKVEETYNSRVKGYVVDFSGKVLENVNVETVNIDAEYKKPAKERQYPVYEITSESNPNETEFYVIAGSGKGLWDKISAFISLKNDLATINGIVFSHKAETPGLGARITDDEAVYSRYAGKTIFEGENIAPIVMKKGEGNDYSNDPHAVDGMSGATKTAIGVNDMLADYLTAYESFIKSKKSKI